jgi:hypothetical protein
MKKVKIIMWVENTVVLEEDTITTHKENLSYDDFFTEEYIECTEEEQYKECLLQMKEAVQQELKRIIGE